MPEGVDQPVDPDGSAAGQGEQGEQRAATLTWYVDQAAVHLQAKRPSTSTRRAGDGRSAIMLAPCGGAG